MLVFKLESQQCIHKWILPDGHHLMVMLHTQLLNVFGEFANPYFTGNAVEPLVNALRQTFDEVTENDDSKEASHERLVNRVQLHKVRYVHY